jgi:hypothetical protein
LGAAYAEPESDIPKNTEFFGDTVHYTDKGAKIVALSFYEYIMAMKAYWLIAPRQLGQ